MKTPTLEEMLKAGVHFGHTTSRWHPKMNEFIFTERQGVHVIDLQKTLKKIEETCEAARKMAAEGKKIVFVSTKPQAREIVKQAAIDCGMPYLTDRWIGGLLTNFDEIKKLIKSYVDTKQKEATGELEKYTKKEQLEIKKDLEKKDVLLAGLASVTQLPDAVFLPSLQNEKTAVTEANKTGVTVIGIADSNANPDKSDYFIPANDDAVKSITMMVGLVADAIKEGREEFEKKNAAAAKKDEKTA